MIIDSHQHFWNYDPIRDSWIDETMMVLQCDFLPLDLQQVFRENGIDGCVAVQADQSEEETEFLLRLAIENDFIKGVVGWVDLCSNKVDERLSYFSKNAYFKGVRHILQAEEDTFMLDKKFLNGISQLQKHDLVYDILIYPKQLKSAIALVEMFPRQIFVLDHLAKPNIKDGEIGEWERMIGLLAKYPNVYCKLSGMVTEADWKLWSMEDISPYINVIINCFGTNRILYGSDWPVCLLAAKYDEVLGVVEKAIEGLSINEQEAIMGKTAQKVYHLKM